MTGKYTDWFDTNLNPGEIAFTLYTVTKGDENLLKEDYEPAKGNIWSEAARDLLGEDSLKNRWLLYKFWSDNRHDVQGKYRGWLTGVKQLSTSTKETSSNRSTVQRYCFCEKAYREDIDPNMIECGTCFNWYHAICVDVQLEDDGTYKGNWTCQACLGGVLIPPIFECSKYISDAAARSPSLSTSNFLAGVNRASTPKNKSIVGSQRKDSLSKKQRSYSESHFGPQGGNAPQHENDALGEESAENVFAHVYSDEERSHKFKNLPSQKDLQGLGEVPKKIQRSPATQVQSVEELRNEEEEDFNNEGEGPPGGIQTVHQIPGEYDGGIVFINTSHIQSNFVVRITYAEWMQHVTVKLITVAGLPTPVAKHEMKPGYTSFLAKLFTSGNDQCVLHFNKHEIFETWRQKTAKYFKCYANCSREKCTARYVFDIQCQPEQDSAEGGQSKKKNVPITIRKSNGDIKHISGERKYRSLRGDERQQEIEAIKHKKPSLYYKEKMATAPTNQIYAGNFNLVKSLKTYIHLKQEAVAAEDFSSDQLEDFIVSFLKSRERLKGKVFDGYGRVFSMFPLRVINFTEKQLMCLHLKTSVEDDGVIFLDATTIIPHGLPPPMDLEGKDPLVYTMAITGLKDGDGPFTVAEMCSTDGTSESIGAFIKYLIFWKVTGDLRPFCGLKQGEADFSKPIMIAFIYAMMGLEPAPYMNLLWKAMITPLTSGQLNKLFAMHVCKVHVLRFLRKKTVEIYKGHANRDEIYVVILDWTRAVVNANSMESFHRRVWDIAILTGYKYMNDEVAERRARIKEATERIVDGPWMQLDADTYSENDPFYIQSAFGRYAKTIIDIVTQKNLQDMNQLTGDEEENPFYSPEFLNYQLLHVLPYWPVISHTVLNLKDLSYRHDTTNIVESLQKTYKWDYLPNLRTLYLGRWFRSMEMLITALINTFLSSATEAQRRKYIKHPKGDGTQSKQKKVGEDTQAQGGTGERTKGTDAGTDAKTLTGQLNPALEEEQFKDIQKRSQTPRPTTIQISHIPFVKWGGRYFSNNVLHIMRNTCSFDNALQGLLILKYVNSSFVTYINTSTDQNDVVIKDILERLEEGDIIEGKKLWVSRLLIRELQEDMDLSGDLAEFSFVPLGHLAFVMKQKICSNKQCPGSSPNSTLWTTANIQSSSVHKFVEKMSQEKHSTCLRTNKGVLCRSKFVMKYTLDHVEPPIMVFVNISPSQTLTRIEDGSPAEITIFGQVYSKFAMIFLQTNSDPLHFVTVFSINNDNVYYDGTLKKFIAFRALSKHEKLLCVWFIKK